MSGRQIRKWMIFFSVLVIAAVAVGVLLYFVPQIVRRETVHSGQESDVSGDERIYYNGGEYRYNRKLLNILVTGIDKSEEVRIRKTPGRAGQADFILLVSLDRGTQTGRLLQIPRDLITDVDLYDVLGEYFITVKAPAAIQYAYGNGEKSSNRAMMKCISRVLYDIPIDDYLSMNVAGLPVLNDAVGGVPMPFSKDYTEIGEEFKEGATVTLDGKQAERFVRYRDTSVTGSSMERMARQRQYLLALFDVIKEQAEGQSGYREKLLKKLDKYVVTDMSGKQFDRLLEYDLDVENIEVIPGEISAGKEYDEFHVDEEKLKELLIDMFYVRED